MGDSVFGKDVKCKKCHKTNSLSENPHFIFSLAYGLRIIIPPNVSSSDKASLWYFSKIRYIGYSLTG